MAARFSKEGIIRAKASIEAGYVNNKNDLGGETNHGITIATAREFGYTGAMKDLTEAQALDIYDKGWWQKMLLDQVLQINPVIADRLFDFGINSGRGNAITTLQRMLNVLNRQAKLYPDIVVDGGMGKNTIASLKSFQSARGDKGLNVLAFSLTCHQVAYYTDISEKRMANEEFTYGWYDRVYREMPEYIVQLGLCQK